MNLLATIKENDQDFEWYPTTSEMLTIVSRDISKHFSTTRYFRHNGPLKVLDVGAGNGSALNTIGEKFIGEVAKYAIEKSSLLIDAMPHDIYVVGTDFHAQTLIDKEVDILFCNPPYSQYESWATRIITEANCRLIYLIIPERWRKEPRIKDALKQRGAKSTVISSFDFLDSEYRKARAKVDIIRIERREFGREKLDDPFSLWFDSVFAIAADEQAVSDSESKEQKKQRLHEVVKGANLIERLEELYQKDLEHLYENYRAIEKLDAALLKELHVDVKALKEGMRLRIAGLKNLYWQELFNNLSSITDRLTKQSRERMLDRLTTHTLVDFTTQNAYAIVIWAVKNANHYLDEQLKDVYMWMSQPENVRGYKSNVHFVADRWRYNKQEMERYALDYRLVFRVHNTFSDLGYDRYDYPNKLSRKAHDAINDILTIARNLGFSPEGSTMDRQWAPGEEQSFTAHGKEFLKVRAFKNGNIHCKFEQKFIRKLNVEAGRLNGWLKSPEETSHELDIPLDEVIASYGTNLQIAARNVPLLTGEVA